MEKKNIESKIEILRDIRPWGFIFEVRDGELRFRDPNDEYHRRFEGFISWRPIEKVRNIASLEYNKGQIVIGFYHPSNKKDILYGRIDRNGLDDDEFSKARRVEFKKVKEELEKEIFKGWF